jgi:hypothetical protein
MVRAWGGGRLAQALARSTTPININLATTEHKPRMARTVAGTEISCRRKF